MVGLLAGVLYLIGDAASKEYGLLGRFLVMVFLAGLIPGSGYRLLGEEVIVWAEKGHRGYN